MYSNPVSQALNLTHFTLSFIGIFLVLPALLFAVGRGDWLDERVRGLIKMTFFMIVLGYMLVIVKLFEVLAIVLIFAVMIVWTRLRRIDQREQAMIKISTPIFDYLDGEVSVQDRVLKQTGHTSQKAITMAYKWVINPYNLARVLLFGVIIGIIVVIRYADAVTHAAPAMSDGYVTLAWMKYIDNRILFHDGIYPQGFHIILAVIGKFAFIDPLYVLKYMGPLNSILISFSIFYTVSRYRGGTQGALLGLFLYGVLGFLWLGADWERQVATNSQEFGLIFVLPTLHFLHQYLRLGDKQDLLTTFMGASITGLVHTVAFMFLVIGAVAVIAACLLSHFRNSVVRAGWIMVAGFFVGVVSLLPLVIGLLLGRHLNRSASDYATSFSHVQVLPPTLSFADYLGILAVLALLIHVFVQALRGHYETQILSAAIFSFLTFLLYYVGGVITKSVVLELRTSDLWAMAAPFALGVAWAAWVSRWSALRWRGLIESGILSIVIVVALLQYSPRAIYPYKMEWDEEVQEILAIKQQYGLNDWLIVGPQIDYALVLGSGYRMDDLQLITAFDPLRTPLTLRGGGAPDRNIPQNVFVFVQKHIFTVSKSNSVYSLLEPTYRLEAKDQQLLGEWLVKMRRKSHISTYYRGQHIIVYHIQSIQ